LNYHHRFHTLLLSYQWNQSTWCVFPGHDEQLADHPATLSNDSEFLNQLASAHTDKLAVCMKPPHGPEVFSQFLVAHIVADLLVEQFREHQKALGVWQVAQ
jgi:hypothetical protein